MHRLVTKGAATYGLPPGTLVHIGERRMEEAKITVLTYDEEQVHESEPETVDLLKLSEEGGAVTWINVDGLHDIGMLEGLGERFGLHPLVLEDILHTDQRPKLEDYGTYIFVVLKALCQDAEGSGEVQSEQVSLVLGSGYVLSFQEQERQILKPVRERILSGRGRIRRMGAGYLAYALIDAVVDHYFVILERLGERLESLEDDLVAQPTTETLHLIQGLKREMVFLRKSIWPLREVVGSLERGQSPLIAEATGVYLRDVYDHTIQVIDGVEMFRDVVSGMLDIYLSSVSNRMNEVMKVLTIIATVFIPLTYIAGVYGMNFQHMPELGWRWGYPMVWLVMVVIAALMVAFFRRRGWL